MVSKCANPACSEKFLHFHEGKLFYLSPTPEVVAATGRNAPWLDQRFWLCDRCCKLLTLVWGGTEVKLIPLAKGPISSPSAATEETELKKNAERRRRTAVALE